MRIFCPIFDVKAREILDSRGNPTLPLHFSNSVQIRPHPQQLSHGHHPTVVSVKHDTISLLILKSTKDINALSCCLCIIFTGCRSREFGDKIHSICQEIQQKVKEVIGIETSIGIGS